jgi:hypothetical protein
MLRAYIESNLAFMRTYPNHILAILEIWSNSRAKEGRLGIGSTWIEAAVEHLEALLRWGQENGEFREFCPRVMAMAIRNAIDGVPPQRVTNENLDLDAYARELVSLFDCATRSES